MLRTKRVWATLAVLLILVCCLTCFVACSKGGADSYDRKEEERGGERAPYVTTDDRLIVYTVSMEISVEKPEEKIAGVKEKLGELGGYDAGSQVNRAYGYASYTLKVPTTKLDELLRYIRTGADVAYESLSTEDVTDSYVAAEEKKKALEGKKAALEEMLTQEGLSAEEKLAIWDRIYEIASKIDELSTEMSGYKKQADYSTVYLTVYETEVYREPSFWDTLGQTLSGSGKSVGKVFGWILTALVALLPYIGIVAVGFGLYVLVKFIVCKARKKPFTLFKGVRDRRALRKQRKEEIERAYRERASRAKEDAPKG